MKLIRSWLTDWVETHTNNQALADKLTMAGLEVDAISPICGDFTGVVLGKITQCDPHPNADKLQICQVDIGQKDTLEIICGAKNARTDLWVAVAKVGAKLPGFVIKKAKLRGVYSYGMLCSASELGLNTDLFANDGILEINSNQALGSDIKEVLTLNDVVIELDITPNRGDCFSVLGIAREIATYENLTLKSIEPKNTVQIEDTKNIHIHQPEACPCYLARIIKGINNTIQTPQWLKARLIYAGQKPHSLIVDITNYVLLELGQPLHAFDLDKINGDISIDYTQDKQSLNLLDGSKVNLSKKTLLIKDEKSILAIAGVMGGMNSATTTKTTDILLESAFFQPAMIAGKARYYGLHTESSLRFERGVDFTKQRQALERATELITQIAGGRVAPIIEKISTKYLPKLPSIHLKKTSIERLLGLKLDLDWIKKQFKQLGFVIDKIQNEDIWIRPPSFRFDITLEVDLIEELARLYGYDQLPTQTLNYQTKIQTQTSRCINTISGQLVANGYTEVISYSFISRRWHQLLYPQHSPLNLANPISEQMSIMRTGLLAGLLQTMVNNQRHGQKEVRFFETGLCFTGLESKEQQQKIAGILSGNRINHFSQVAEKVDFYDIKHIVSSLLEPCHLLYEFSSSDEASLHPHQRAKVLLNGQNIGFIGALSPIIEAELNLEKTFVFELNLLAILQQHPPQYQTFSTQQSMSRDISILIDTHLTFKKIKQSIFALKQIFLVDLIVFDVYTNETISRDKKSLSLKLTYQADRTLIDNEIEAFVLEIIQMLSTTYGAKQR